ncbi:MAG: transcriptional repressor NrdR [Deltaproteobacteria bacterium]|nr:transcriptional repressor NrdR [Deltaproteobacteria bacterium]
MRCPVCKHDETSVVDSRDAKEGEEIRRRRECLKCKQRFTTYERADSVFPWVIKKDGRREEFNPEKIKAGVLRALEKRPVSIHDSEDLVNQVIQALVEKGEKEIPSSMIGEEIMRRLKGLDEVAYVRFASVYRQFRDINDFMSELSSLLTKRS